VYVTCVVLAAGNSVRFRTGSSVGRGPGQGGSRGLGETKQLLPYRGRTLLDAALDIARVCDFDQRIVTLGGSAAAVRARVDLGGFTMVDVPTAGSGCGASVSTAVGAVDPRADGLVLLLGDQPQVRAAAVAALVATAGDSALGVCRYDDGLGHPFWCRRDVFGALRGLHGDKAVWKLLHSGDYEVTEVPVAGPVPIDVDTRADYERLLAGDRLVG
jgi:molybdenum cofactor cytidylyltransferase